MELKGIVESLIFAASKPLTLQQLRNLTNTPLRQLKAIVDELVVQYQGSGIQIAEAGGGYQFRTHPDAASWVRRLLAGRPPRLTRPMLETLAIIAYQQPITRPEIEEVRGVDCGNTLRVLLERHLLRILGKKEEAGRPLLYGTTKFFLEFFSLPSLKDLPSLKEFTELSPDHEEKVEFVFGNQGDDEQAEPVEQADIEAHGPVDPLEGPPEPPDLRAAATESAEAPETADAAEAEAADAETADAETPDAETADAETADAETAGPDAPAPKATPPSPPAMTEEEEDNAVLDSLDRAIARAGSVLREINPRPKPSPHTPSEGHAPDGNAAEASTPTPEPSPQENTTPEAATEGERAEEEAEPTKAPRTAAV
ncbi:MAG: SMC-Scp complex subunit ScpB [Deltaproteobacteria bacterium]|nr:SMC-Scp complex subunit ScpB [Deltaproteobacteria bacterium]